MDTKTRNWIIAGAAVVIAFLGVWGFSSSNTANATEQTGENLQVISLEVAETVEASGTLEAQPFASLVWKTGGVVEAVNVEVGDFVKEGDILLTLQPESTSASIVSAQADLITAQDNLEDLLSSGTSLAQAKIDLIEAQEEYDDALYYLKYLNNDTNIPQTLYTAELVQTRNGWEYKYETDNFKGPAPEDWIVDAENDLALKKGQLEDAQREYDRLLAGEESSDVQAARAKLQAAQTTVNSLYIVAPFDGQVLWVDDVSGNLVNANDVAVHVADMNQLYVDAQVDESDIAKVRVGNQVEITLEAVANIQFTGKVVLINPVGQAQSGLIKYTVRIALDAVEVEGNLPLGTSADVVIEVKEAEMSLAVPITTIHNDAQGEYVLVLQSDETTQRVDIISSIIVGDYVVVSGDLKEGQTLKVNDGTSFEAPNPFGGDEE